MNEQLIWRIERLEKRNRLLFGLLLTIALAFGTVLLIGAAGPIPERIVARSISVVGEAGKNTASLVATRDGWVVLSFRDLKGDQKAALMMTPSGKPALTFFDNHHARLDLGVVDGPKSEEFSVQLRDSKGKIIWQPEFPNAY
jgi:hypothetical protein